MTIYGTTKKKGEEAVPSSIAVTWSLLHASELLNERGSNRLEAVNVIWI